MPVTDCELTFLKIGSSSAMIFLSLVPSGNVRTRTRRFLITFVVVDNCAGDSLPKAMSSDSTVRLMPLKTTGSDFRLRLSDVDTKAIFVGLSTGSVSLTKLAPASRRLNALFCTGSGGCKTKDNLILNSFCI